jgi:2'-5' RNA ligase
MTMQASLFGEPEAHPTDRLLLALYPDAKAAARMVDMAQRLKAAHGLTGKLIATERLHVTLIHIGDFFGLPKGVVTAAGEAAGKISIPPFEIAFDRAASFSGQPGNQPFVLRMGQGRDGLMAFQRGLCVEMIKAGVRYKSGAQFTPHVTLLYDRLSVPEQMIEPIRWTAREFVLVHSLLGQTRHIPLGRWSLS